MLKKTLLILVVFFLMVAAKAQAFDDDYTEDINGTKLHFRVRGTDPNNPYLLILHGGPGFSAHMFYPWGRSIEKVVTVVYLDQRGCGESEHLTLKNHLMPTLEEVKDYTIPNLLKDIEEVRIFLKVPKWFVLGHSWGGMLGLEYVTAYPDSVQGFIFVDGLLSQPRAQDAILTSVEKHVAEDEKSTSPEKQELAKRLKPLLPGVKKMPPGQQRMLGCMELGFAMFQEIYYANATVGMAYNTKILDALRTYEIARAAISLANETALALILTEHYATRDDTPLLSKVTCPTLVVNGKQDGLILPKDAEAVQQGIKGATLLLLDNCGHFPFAEQPAAFTGAVIGFVKANP
jgi:proline iminopeptidase